MSAASDPTKIYKEVKEKMRANIGIDIGKKKCDYCVVSTSGRVLESGHYRNTPQDAKKLAERIAGKYNKCRAACEATGNMWNISYSAFENAGIEIKLANTYKMAIIAKTGKKTDKVDAEKIAQVLRMNMIPECFVPSENIRGLRAIMRDRIVLVQDRTRVINRIHSLLDRHSIGITKSCMNTTAVLEQLESTSLKPVHDEIVLQQCVKQIRFLNEEIVKMDEHIKAFAGKSDDVKILASLTGVGIFTALLLAAEIGTIDRFDGPKKMVSWAGLCPAIHQSGDKKYMGRIKKFDTNRTINWAMIEAANTAIRFDDRMKSVYESARKRHAGKHSLAIVVVVANKMITIAWHMLKTKTPYSSHNKRLYKSKLTKIEQASKKK